MVKFQKASLLSVSASWRGGVHEYGPWCSQAVIQVAGSYNDLHCARRWNPHGLPEGLPIKHNILRCSDLPMIKDIRYKVITTEEVSMVELPFLPCSEKKDVALKPILVFGVG